MGRAAAELVLGPQQQQPQQQNVYHHAHYYPPTQPYYYPLQPPVGPVYTHPPPPAIPQPYQQPTYQHVTSPHATHGLQQFPPPPITPQHTHYSPHLPANPPAVAYPPPPQQQRPPTVHANSWPNPQPTYPLDHKPIAFSTNVSKHDFHARPASIYMPPGSTPPNAPRAKPPITDAGPVTEPESTAQPPPAYDSIKFEKPVAPALPQRHKSQSAVSAQLLPESDRPNLPPRRKHAQSVSVVPSSGPAGQDHGLTSVPAATAEPEPLIEEATEEPSDITSLPVVTDDMLRPKLPLRPSRSQSLSGHVQATLPNLPVRSDTNPFRVSSHATGPAALSSNAVTGANRLTVPTAEEFVASLKTEPIPRPSTEPPATVPFTPSPAPEVPIATKPLVESAASKTSESVAAQPTHQPVAAEPTMTKLNIPMPEEFAAPPKMDLGPSVPSVSLPYPDHHDHRTQMPMSPDDEMSTNIGLFMRRPVSAIYESHEIAHPQSLAHSRRRPMSAMYSPYEDCSEPMGTVSDSILNTLRPSPSIIAPLKIRKPSLPSVSAKQTPSTTALPAQLTANPDVRKQPSNPTLSSPPDHVFELNGETTAATPRPESNAAVHEIGAAAAIEPQPGRLRKQGTIPLEWESHGGFSLGFDIGSGKRSGV